MDIRAVFTLVPPGKALIGKVVLPGSKSITNRALLLASLAKGTSRITGVLKSDDTRYMSEALIEMGIAIEEPDDTTFVVTSIGKLTAPSKKLFLGNAGTAVRFLTAAVTTVNGRVTLNGDEYMQKRPIGPLVNALRCAGLSVETATGCPPVDVFGNAELNVERFEIDGGLSSQYVSALLMLSACGTTPIDVELVGPAIGAEGYVDLTVACMRAFGAEVTPLSTGAWQVASTGYVSTDYQVEFDASAATYLWAAQALTQGTIEFGVGNQASTQPDAMAQAIIATFPDMPAVINGSQLQDAVPTLAVLAAFNNSPVRFVGLANLRVKECDRIKALYEGLNGIHPGLASIEGDDLIVASDPLLKTALPAVLIETHSDHRIAMAFALAGLKLPGIGILDPGCVAKTYPGYWTDLESLGVEVLRSLGGTE